VPGGTVVYPQITLVPDAEAGFDAVFGGGVEAVFGGGADDGTFGRQAFGILPTPALYASVSSCCRAAGSLVALACCTSLSMVASVLTSRRRVAITGRSHVGTLPPDNT
jgi:hypothetical protein